METASKRLYLHHNWDTFAPILAPDSHIAGEHTPKDRKSAQTSLSSWSEKKMNAWKSKVVPTFNSIAIESTMGSDTGMADAYYYANDDMYLGRDISAADMISPLFGPSLLIRKSKMVRTWYHHCYCLSAGPLIYFSSPLPSGRALERCTIQSWLQCRVSVTECDHSMRLGILAYLLTIPPDCTSAMPYLAIDSGPGADHTCLTRRRSSRNH